MASRQPRKVLTMEELANLIEDGEDNDPLDQIALVTVLPPTNDGNVTDEEEFNEDEIVFNDNVSAYVELAGQFECETLGDIEGYAEILAGLKETTDNAEVTPFGKKTFKKLKTAVSCAPKSPNWINNGNIKYDWSETTATLEGIENELVEKTKSLSPVELFLTFFGTNHTFMLYFHLIFKKIHLYSSSNFNCCIPADVPFKGHYFPQKRKIGKF